jgi:hypothetical protein
MDLIHLVSYIYLFLSEMCPYPCILQIYMYLACESVSEAQIDFILKGSMPVENGNSHTEACEFKSLNEQVCKPSSVFDGHLSRMSVT